MGMDAAMVTGVLGLRGAVGALCAETTSWPRERWLLNEHGRLRDIERKQNEPE